jgi:hypothetical protein
MLGAPRPHRYDAGMILIALLLAAAAPPHDFLRDEENALLHFNYGWPAEAQAIPRLRARLAREMEGEHRQAVANARENRRNARANGFEYNVEDFDKVWEVAGNNIRLLSLTASLGSYSGGAHPNTSFHALLWDKAGNREVTAASVLGAAALRGFSARYCAALDAERAERREEPVVHDPQDPFTTCPAIAEQVLAPADADHDGRFDTLRILLGPYIAGPYVEGEYLLDLPIGAADLARIPAPWRASFETSRARQAR